MTHSIRPIRRHARHGVSLIALSVALAGPAAAGPEGGVVTHGAASIARQGQTTTITQTTPRASLNWESFDVGRDEAVRFDQPDRRSIALNRIGGNRPSEIQGSLSANGQVWLLNPQGVMFGEGARVETSGLLATTARISDADFAAGRGTFDGGTASSAIVNRGSIDAGEGGVVLVAPRVENHGRIASAGGDVQLHAGPAFTVDFAGDGLLSYVVEDDDPMAVALENTGTIAAEGGAVQISAAAADRMTDSVVSLGGLVEATGFAVEDGKVTVTGPGILEVAGEISARRGETGGDVVLNAEGIALTDTARIDVSGPAGGGTVDLGGRTSPIPARRVAVLEGAEIAADALTDGTGGVLNVWSEEWTSFDGRVTARGAGTGDGGFADISSRGALGFLGQADLSSPAGANGTLLFDPDTIIVAATGPDTSELAADNQILLADRPGEDLVVAGFTSSFVPGTDIVLEATELITINAELFLSGDDLRVTSQGSIDINAPVTGSGSDLTFSAAGRIDVNNALSTTNGDVTVIAGTEAVVAPEAIFVDSDVSAGLPPTGIRFGSASVSGGDLSISGGSVTILGDLGADRITLRARSGDLAIGLDGADLAGPDIAAAVSGNFSGDDFVIAETAAIIGPDLRYSFNGNGTVGDGVARLGGLLDLSEVYANDITRITFEAGNDLRIGDIGFDPSAIVPAGAEYVFTAGEVVSIEGQVGGSNIDPATGLFRNAPGQFAISFGEADGLRPFRVTMSGDGRIGVVGSGLFAPPDGLGFFVDGDVTLDPDAFNSATILAADGTTTIDIAGDFLQRNTALPDATEELIDGEPSAGAVLGDVLLLNAASLELYGVVNDAGGTDARGNVRLGEGFVALDVHQVNDCAITADVCRAEPPVLEDDLAVTDADMSVILDPLANDMVGGSGTITLVEIDGVPVEPGDVIDLVGGGTLTVNPDGSLTFDPGGEFDTLAEGSVAAQSLTYTVDDGAGTMLTASIVLNVRGIVPPEVDPVLVDDLLSTDADTPVLSDPVANDTAGTGGMLGIVEINGTPVAPGDSVALPAGGTLTLNEDGTLSFDPDMAFDDIGSETTASQVVELTLADAEGMTFMSSLTIFVMGVDMLTPPMIMDDAVGTPADMSVDFDPVANDDPGSGAPLMLTEIDGMPVMPGDTVPLEDGGSLIVNDDGSLTFDPEMDFDALGDGATDAQSVTYTVSDGEGTELVGTLTITVTGVGDPMMGMDPVIVDDSVGADPGMTVDFDPVANDVPGDSGALTLVTVDGMPVDAGDMFDLEGGGALTVNADGTLTFDPGDDFTDAAEGEARGQTVGYEVVAENGDVLAGEIEISVTGVNDPPMAVADAAETPAGSTVTVDVVANDIDPDGDPLIITGLGEGGLSLPGSEGGLFTIGSESTLFFDPLDDFAMLVEGSTIETTVTYAISDPFEAGDTALATITVLGTFVPEEPVPMPEPDLPEGAFVFPVALADARTLSDAVITPDIEVLSGFFDDIGIIQPPLEDDDPVTNRGDDEDWPR